MKLYFSPFSPYVRKCLVVAHELGLNERITLLNCAVHPVQRDATVIASNPLGKIPTLITDDGQALYDSRVICEYLNDIGKGQIFAPPGTQRWRALTLQSLADGMLDAALLVRYEANARPEALRWAEWSNGQMDKITTAMVALEADAALRYANADIGSLSLACTLWYLDVRFADLGWRTRYTQLAAWYAAFSQRASCQASWAL
jgi:glutathione S-transferase